MSTAKKLAWIAAAYVLAVVGAFAAVVVNELRMSVEIAQGSSGMVAFGDVVLFVFVTGFLGLLPSWFLLRLAVEKVPRALLVAELVAAVMGPVSWRAVIAIATRSGMPSEPGAVGQLFGLFAAFVAIPRMILGPVLVVIEAATLLMLRGRVTRGLLVAAMLMDLVPLGLFALHMLRAARY
jgi:hypothetical protein